MMKAALVVATCNRPGELRKMLESLRVQTRPPYQVIVVDAGSTSVEDEVRGSGLARVEYVASPVRSASRQRNLGLAAVSPSADFIGFADDDVVFPRDAFEAMERFWEYAGAEFGGASFNLLNHPPLAYGGLKGSAVSRAMGLYSRRRGVVLSSGFQTLIGTVSEDLVVEWLSTGAVLWRRRILDSFRFDEWYDGYSYLEDLDFSYRVGKLFRLSIVARAGYYHYPGRKGRGSGFVFGRREVLNRVHFVKKNPSLSLWRCYLALAVRTQISLWEGIRRLSPHGFQRAWGNIQGIWEALWT